MAKDEHEDVPMTPQSADSQDRERLLAGDGEANVGADDKLMPVEGQEVLVQNLITRNALIAQGGIWLLTAMIWIATFVAGLIFFSAHVLLNSAGLLLITQSIFILQPTRTPNQKRRGTAFHFIFNAGSLSALLGGLVIIEINKFSHDGAHFGSLHAILGLITYLFLLAQGVVGFTQYYTPMLYGNVDKAKSVWKYHRMSGYTTIALGLATVVAAMGTGYNERVLKLSVWPVAATSLLVVGGLVPGISLKKFGWK